MAREFSESFSELYNDIAEKESIYLKLEGLFRHVALAKIMKYKDLAAYLDYLLNQFPVREVKTDSTLPGITHVEDFQYQRDFADHTEIVRFWLPSCGGVSIEIEAQRHSFIREDLNDLKTDIFGARPSLQSLFWDFGIN